LGATRDKAEVTRADLDVLTRAALMRAPYEELVERIERLKHEPVANSFGRLLPQLERIAKGLGKPSPRKVIDHNGVRLPASRFGPFWAASVHLIRNFLDHGIEPPAERVAAGKSPEGTVTLRSKMTANEIIIEMADDGRGIAWDLVAAKAREKGLPHKTRADLESALFSSGFTTKSEASAISGRGMGLSAVAEKCAELGGSIRLESAPGRGARFTFTFPRQQNENSVLPNPPSARVVS
jgi:two-component system chemotaxis sensor kinase CheA